MVKNKSLRTNHPCAVCSLYGHYSHHFPDFLEYRALLRDLCKHSHESDITILDEIHPLASSSDTTNTIYTISSSSSPSVYSVIEDPFDLSTDCFNNDEEILEALSTPEYPWDDMHHHSFFIPDEPPSSSNQYSVEAKDFIHGKVDWFKNPIMAPDSFEEGNMANISPTIKVNISTTLEVVEDITLEAYFYLEEVASY